MSRRSICYRRNGNRDRQRLLPAPRSFTRVSGFTLIELIAVMVVVGVLAVAALPRFVDRNTFEARGFYDQSLAMLRYAQKIAIAQRSAVYFNANAATRTICLTYTHTADDIACADTSVSGVPDPADQASRFRKAAPGGITSLSGVSFLFTALGQPSPDAEVSFNITGDGTTRTITVERETGYVH